MIKTNIKTLFSIAVTLLMLGFSPAVATVIYVDADASAGGDGATWETAYKYLQDALDDAVKDDEVWVKKGKYRPDCNSANSTGNNDRTATFGLVNGVALYGGFSGGEGRREQRDWQANETILTGDLNGNDVGFTNNGENSYHVLTGNDTDSTAVIDGFTITAGNANADVWPDDGGGGMNNHQGSPTIMNCTFRGNSCFADGGGMRTWGRCKPNITECAFIGNSSKQEGGGMMNGPASSPTVTNCTFRDNSAGEDGGGMYNNETISSKVTNCIFTGNTVKLTGAGMYNVNSSKPTVTNCTFSRNSAGVGGGGVSNYKAGIKVTNCIFWNNSAPDGKEIYLRSTESEFSSIDVDYSDIQQGRSGIYLKGPDNIIHWGADNIDADPRFKDANLRLSSGSPCIDAGENTAIPGGVETDIDGNPRVISETVDMGAYELESTSAVHDLVSDQSSFCYISPSIGMNFRRENQWPK